MSRIAHSLLYHHNIGSGHRIYSLSGLSIVSFPALTTLHQPSYTLCILLVHTDMKVFPNAHILEFFVLGDIGLLRLITLVLPYSFCFVVYCIHFCVTQSIPVVVYTKSYARYQCIILLQSHVYSRRSHSSRLHHSSGSIPYTLMLNISFTFFTAAGLPVFYKAVIAQRSTMWS